MMKKGGMLFYIIIVKYINYGLALLFIINGQCTLYSENFIPITRTEISMPLMTAAFLFCLTVLHTLRFLNFLKNQLL